MSAFLNLVCFISDWDHSSVMTSQLFNRYIFWRIRHFKLFHSKPLDTWVMSGHFCIAKFQSWFTNLKRAENAKNGLLNQRQGKGLSPLSFPPFLSLSVFKSFLMQHQQTCQYTLCPRSVFALVWVETYPTSIPGGGERCLNPRSTAHLPF